jgi:hypothetical protein
LLADALTNTPLLLVFLKLLEDTDERLSFVLAEHSHDFCHVLDHSQLDVIILVLEESIDHPKKIFFSVTFSYQFSHFMQTLT